MNPTSKMVYVPPRPNLGPEPLAQSRTGEALVVIAGMALVLLLLWRIRRRRRSSRPVTKARPSLPPEGTDSPRERMIAWSVAIRESLAARFGPAWLAKTTEEIAGEPSLAAALGPERAAWLIGFLADADRAKFSDDADHLGPGPAESELLELVEFVASRGAGTSSAIGRGGDRGRNPP